MPILADIFILAVIYTFSATGIKLVLAYENFKLILGNQYKYLAKPPSISSEKSEVCGQHRFTYQPKCLLLIPVDETTRFR